MRERDRGSAAVADHGRLIGILTSRDLLRAFAGRARPPDDRLGAGGGEETRSRSSARTGPAETLLGEPRPTGENATPAHGRLQDIRVPGKRVNRAGGALAFEEKDDFALADKGVLSLDSRLLDIEGRPLLDEPPRLLDSAAPDRHNHRNTSSRRMLGTESSEEIADLPHEAYAAQRSDQHTLAGMALENDRLVAIDPFTGSAADLDGRELVK
jgi:hypothetical protein